MQTCFATAPLIVRKFNLVLTHGTITDNLFPALEASFKGFLERLESEVFQKMFKVFERFASRYKFSGVTGVIGCGHRLVSTHYEYYRDFLIL